MVLKSPLALQPLPGTIALFPPPLPLALQPLPRTSISIPSPSLLQIFASENNFD